MVPKLIAHFVATTLALALAFAAILKSVGAIVSEIRSPVCSVSLATVPRITSLSLATLPGIGTFALPTLSIVRAVQERCCRPASNCSSSSSRRRTR